MKKPWLIAASILAVWGIYAWFMPVVLDEAYYLTWTKKLALGYFDHPPGVAWLLSLTAGQASDIFSIRLATLGAGLVTITGVLHFFRGLGIKDGAALSAGLILCFLNLMGLAYGVITTPDTVLLAAWAWALGESAYALQGKPKRWLAAGAVTGIGLWGKYMMVLIGPVMLWGLLRDAQTSRTKPQLKTPWPYLGGVLALLVFTPHLVWNHQHDWVTMKFQLSHGLQDEHLRLPGTSSALGLPYAEEAKPGSPEWNIALPFLESAQKEEKQAQWYDSLLGGLNRYIGYYLSQIALWGALLVVMWQRKSARPRFTPGHEGLVFGATFVPLLVFGGVSIASHVEANWSAMYLMGLSAWLAPVLAPDLGKLAKAALVNIAIVLAIVLHARSPFLPVRPKVDRVLKETHGFDKLASYIAHINQPTWADTYQITAMNSFYSPGSRVTQWPGITRDSEYTRVPTSESFNYTDTLTPDGFQVILSSLPPPKLATYKIVNLTELRDCKNAELQVISSVTIRSAPQRCQSPVHRWYMAQYQSEVGLKR